MSLLRVHGITVPLMPDEVSPVVWQALSNGNHAAKGCSQLLRYCSFGLALLLALAWVPAYALGDNPNRLTIEDASGRVIHIFTIGQLKTEFPQQTYDTHTPWMKKGVKARFRGPRLQDVLARTGLAHSAAIKVIAYDDFVSVIHRHEIQSYDPILAVERQCKPDDYPQGRCKTGQKLRPIDMLENGPIFIVWPFDRLPDTYVPTRNSIWVFFPVVIQALP